MGLSLDSLGLRRSLSMGVRSQGRNRWKRLRRLSTRNWGRRDRQVPFVTEVHWRRKNPRGPALQFPRYNLRG